MRINILNLIKLLCDQPKTFAWLLIRDYKYLNSSQIPFILLFVQSLPMLLLQFKPFPLFSNPNSTALSTSIFHQSNLMFQFTHIPLKWSMLLLFLSLIRSLNTAQMPLFLPFLPFLCPHKQPNQSLPHSLFRKTHICTNFINKNRYCNQQKTKKK